MLEVSREISKMGCIGRLELTNAVTYAEGVVKSNSTRFGELSISEEKIINFPNGILGFPDYRRFTILDYEGDVPFKWLQSIDDPALAFLVVSPDLIKPDYALTMKGSDIADLGEYEDEDIAVFVILTIPDVDPTGMTANLRGPIVINSATMKGKQIILQDDRYAVKHPVLS